MGELIYHYTNAQGLMGILSTSALWATDILYLNDTSELEYASEFMKPHLESSAKEFHEAAETANSDAEIEALRGAEHWDRALAVEPLRASSPTDLGSRLFTISFCEERDLLSQWRGYGQAGFAIGFDRNLLSQSMGTLAKVEYGPEAAQAAILELFNNRDGRPQAATPHRSNYRRAMAHTFRWRYATIKHPSFSEEQEWRLLCMARDVSEVEFRASGLGPVPYIARPFPKDAIQVVVVGPSDNKQLRQDAVHLMVEKYGYGWGVEVVSSGIPFRSL